MVDLENLRANEDRIRKLVNSIYVDKSGLAEPIFDGVINPELYCAAPYRLMWILKEPWDEENSSGGGWSLAQVLNEQPVSSLSHFTFHPIIYIAYGLFNGISTWADMPYVRDMNDPEFVLRRLAFVNVKKLPGVTRGAYSPTIMEWFSRGKAIIMEQIRAYSPNVVFGCSPHLPAILDELQPMWREAVQTVGSADYVWHQKTLFVHVYHPGQSQVSRETYVDDALKAVASARQKNGNSTNAI
jgi:hypothetical protein